MLHATYMYGYLVAQFVCSTRSTAVTAFRDTPPAVQVHWAY